MIKFEDMNFKQPQNGYAPREDSWLLAKTVQECARTFLEKRFIKKALDMGCGSGIQTAALCLSGAKEVMCVDIERSAITAALQMAERYFPHIKIESIQGDLFEHVKGKFDVIVFNPPYVPSEEIKWRDTDGGKKGREIIDRFLVKLPIFLKTNGFCLMLQSSLNGIEMTQQKITKIGLKGEIVLREKLFFEELIVWKIVPN